MSSKIFLNDELLIDDVCLCETLQQRLRGFMFHRVPHHKALLLKDTRSIHMFHVHFDLAIFVLDKDLKVLDKFTIKMGFIPYQKIGRS